MVDEVSTGERASAGAAGAIAASGALRSPGEASDRPHAPLARALAIVLGVAVPDRVVTHLGK
jgi:hypothetical protein